jgi:hypothetical protein
LGTVLELLNAESRGQRFAQHSRGLKMGNGELSSSSAFKMAITPGEQVQNWLSRFGVCQRVEDRNYTNPEPPVGLWTSINTGIAVACLAGFVGMIGTAIFQVLPALVLR